MQFSVQHRKSLTYQLSNLVWPFSSHVQFRATCSTFRFCRVHRTRRAKVHKKISVGILPCVSKFLQSADDMTRVIGFCQSQTASGPFLFDHLSWLFSSASYLRKWLHRASPQPHHVFASATTMTTTTTLDIYCKKTDDQFSGKGVTNWWSHTNVSPYRQLRFSGCFGPTVRRWLAAGKIS